jgi:glutathione synthase/RimK-type ligase-like ATP-grasp enzyme
MVKILARGEALPQLRPAIDEITSRLKLEYYGIDCNLRPDGQMLIFEANANMNNLHGTNSAIRGRLEVLQQNCRGCCRNTPVSR